MWDLLRRRKKRGVPVEVVVLEEELSAEEVAQPGTVAEMFDQYGPEAPENRRMSPTLRKAVALARDQGRWRQAAPVFLDERDRLVNFDVPYLWLADFLEHEGRPQSAMVLAKSAALRCKRKSELLERSAEIALFSGEVHEAVRLFAQSMAVAGRPPDFDETSRQRAFLFMAELFGVFGQAESSRWARGVQDVTHLDEDMIRTIRRAAGRATEEQRKRIEKELPETGKRLRKRITRKG